MTTATNTAYPLPTTEPAATLTVGGQGHDLLDGAFWSLMGGFLTAVLGTAAFGSPTLWLTLGTVFGLAATGFGLAKLVVRKQVEVGRRGEAHIQRTALGIPLGNREHEPGTFDFVSVHDVRNDRIFGTGLKQMIRDLFRPQFELALKGESTEEYLGMHWSADAARQAADELALKTGLTVFDRTMG